MGTASTSSLWQFHSGNIASPFGQAMNSSSSSVASTLFGITTPFAETSSPFRTTSSHFGGFQGTTIGSIGSSTGNQCQGSSLASYYVTPELDGVNGRYSGGKISSISAMPIYKDKSHEELRFEDSELRSKGYSFSNQNERNAFQQLNSQCSPTAFSVPSSQSSFVSPFGSTSTAFGISPSFKNGCASGDNNVNRPLRNSASIASSTAIFGAPRNLGFDFKSTPSIFQSNAAVGSTSSIFGVPIAAPRVPRSESSGFSTNIFGLQTTNTSPFQFSTTTVSGFPSPFSTSASVVSSSSESQTNFTIGAPSTSSFGFSTNIFGLPTTNTSPFQFSTTTGSGFPSPFSTSASVVSSSSGSQTDFTIGSPSTSSFSFPTPSQHFFNSVAASGTSSNSISGTPSSSGSQGTTPWGIGFTTGNQSKGSRITPYSVTEEKVEPNGYLLAKIQSISAMPAYKDKSHEELRVEDYESCNKGGNRPWGGQSGFKSFDKQANIFSCPPDTNFSSVTSLFNPIKSNPSPFMMQGFSTPTSTISMFPTSFKPVNPYSSFPCIFPPQSQSSQPQSTVTSSMPAFTPTINALSLSSPVSQSIPANNFQWPPSLIPFTSLPSSTISSSKPLTTFSPSLLSTSATTLGPWPSSPNASHSGQTAQKVNFLSTSNLNEPSQVANGLIKVTEVGSQNINGQQYISPSTADVSPVVNPFGPQTEVKISVGQLDSVTSIKFGISSIPVSSNPSPVRRAPLLRIRHVSLRHDRSSAQRHNSGSSEPKVPFFSDTWDKPCVVDLLMPRNNPRAWVLNSLSGKENAPLHARDNGEINCGDKATSSSPNVNSTEVIREISVQEEDLPIIVNLHLADDLEVIKQHNNDVLPLIPKLHRDYYAEPSIDLLAAKEKAEPGFCSRVNDFVVGRRDYGSIKFLGETDVRHLDLESIIQFNNREVIVYVDDRKKPPVGQSLNKPAEVTLLNIKCISKKTGMHYTEGWQVQNYKQMLIKKTEEQGAEFISYDPVRGEWKFRVQHF